MSRNVEEEIKSQLEWIKFREDTLGEEHIEKIGFEKIKGKIKENPLVPIGCLATLGALTYGLIAFRRGQTQKSQMMMRTRIAAQGFTIVALLGGIVFGYGGSDSNSITLKSRGKD